jgi:hypothetical protein
MQAITIDQSASFASLLMPLPLTAANKKRRSRGQLAYKMYRVRIA